jgi:4-amino-4-deoxy-L-arabinose transferase-like glycosyltransferase
LKSKSKIDIFSVFIFCLAVLLVFFRIDTYPVQEWDEARRGINAHLMNIHQDYFNYRYVDTFDSFNTKPPLFTWTVALSFKLFGCSNFALRLPSAIYFLAFLILTYNFLRLRVQAYTLYYCLLILIAVEGVLGLHVARSGDTDMMFILFLTLFLIHIYKAVIEQQQQSLYLSLLFIALAFLTKSFAIALILPGILTWIGLYRSRIHLPKRSGLKAAILALLLLCVIVFILVHFQNKGEEDILSQNLLIGMFFNDAVTRFTDASFEFGYKWDYLPVVLDTKFGPIIYVFYALAITYLIKNKLADVWSILKANALLSLMVLSFLSVSVVLLISQNKHQWYIAPAIFPLSFITARLINVFIKDKVIGFRLVVLSLLLVIAFKAYKISAISKNTEIPMKHSHSAIIHIDRHTPQNCIFNLYKVAPSHKMYLTDKAPNGYIKHPISNCEGSYYYIKE